MKNTLQASLGPDDLARLAHSAREAQKLENKWDARIAAYIADKTEKIILSLEEGNGITADLDFEQILTEQQFDVMIRAEQIAREGEELVQARKRLAYLPKAKVPGSLKDLMRLYDEWRHKRYRSKRAKTQAKAIKKAYLEKVQDVWRKYSEDFRAGDAYTQAEVKRKLRDASQTATSRAQTIVRTETTNYYNEARKKFYDQSQDVTHYLFVAVRDAATSEWCTPNTINGKRGRHGLVYAKNDPLLEKERPACHWNCRSELLPLTPANPSHLRLIKNPAIQRRNVTCAPLPKQWRSAS